MLTGKRENILNQKNPVSYTHLNEESLSAKEKAYYRNQAEKCKCNTADSFYRMQASVSGEKVETLIPRGAFEKMSSQLLDRIKTPVRRSLSDAGVKPGEIDEVVLVGGTTTVSYTHLGKAAS